MCIYDVKAHFREIYMQIEWIAICVPAGEAHKMMSEKNIDIVSGYLTDFMVYGQFKDQVPTAVYYDSIVTV